MPALPRVAHAALRNATREDHARLDARFPAGLADIPTYRVYLRGMHRFVADLTAALRLAGDATAFQERCGEAHAALGADLVDLRAPPLPPGPLPDMGTGATRLGWEYVLTGSAMGAKLLLRDAQRLGHDARSGARFLSLHAAAHDWAGVLDRIESVAEADPACCGALAGGAATAFAYADACFANAHDLEECSPP